MPYIFVEELEEGVEYADVVSAEDFNALQTSFADMQSQRDAAIERAEAGEAEAKRMKDKYANRFLTTAAQAKQELKEDVDRDTGPRSFSELFAERENQ